MVCPEFLPFFNAFSYEDTEHVSNHICVIKSQYILQRESERGER